ncbi:MAG: hemerythrin domain-containing protein [Burkholderiaceae bacterium]|jgi:hemerythrin-like domain-containing protein|nr:hemerythrin domain-containing protein [Burkholderiaceae bacterium]
MSQSSTLDTDQPLDNFSQCHAGILTQLDHFQELPALLAPMMRAHQIAANMIHFFRATAFEHHQDEERELFPAVLDSSQAGEEHERVKTLIDVLTREHRALEKQWIELEPQLRKLTKGQPAKVDPEAVRQLVDQYREHARLEEMEFLPLSEKILGRNSNHMAALGLSLHMRHQRTLPPYI